MRHFFHLIPMVSVLIVVYFTYHGLYGNRGLLRLNEIHQEYAVACQESQKIAAEKTLLQKKVEALKNGAPDLLQEEALRVLNVGKETDLVILD